MKRIFVILLALGLGLSASAQVFSEAGEYNDFEVNDVIDISCLSHFDFGFNGLFSGKSDADYADHTAFFQSQKFGFNMIELVIKPFRGFAFTLGADVNWNWYHVNKDFFWMPYEPTPGLIAPRENGTHVLIASKEYYGFKEIKKSELSVCTFSFPIDLNFQAHKFTLTLGASPELNLKGRTRFNLVSSTTGPWSGSTSPVPAVPTPSPPTSLPTISTQPFPTAAWVSSACIVPAPSSRRNTVPSSRPGRWA